MKNKKTYNQKYNDVQEQLFIRGIKPAAYYAYEKERAARLRKLNYPYIRVMASSGRSCLFFRNKKDMHEFMDRHGLTQPIMNKNHSLIGKALGYPPQAYYDFDIEKEDRHFIHYHGFDFVCRGKDVNECAIYMKKHYEIPKELRIEVTISKPRFKKTSA